MPHVKSPAASPPPPASQLDRALELEVKATRARPTSASARPLAGTAAGGEVKIMSSTHAKPRQKAIPTALAIGRSRESGAMPVNQASAAQMAAPSTTRTSPAAIALSVGRHDQRAP